jgi:hypothetical protein
MTVIIKETKDVKQATFMKDADLKKREKANLCGFTKKKTIKENHI